MGIFGFSAGNLIPERVLKASSKRGLLLVVTAICLTSASALIYTGLAPWAQASSGNIQQSSRSSVASEGAFQTLTEFINRSPGERGEVDRLKGSLKSVFQSSNDASSPQIPTQRALGKVFDPEPFSIITAQEGPIELLTSPMGEVATPAVLIPLGPANTSSSPSGSGLNTAPGSFVLAPPASSSPGENGGGSGNPPPLPVGAVPEPSTWALMLMGFFIAGIGLRRSNAKTKRRANLAYN